MMNTKKVLITGASGAVGNEILKQFSALTHQYAITVFDLKTQESSKVLRQYSHLFEIVYGDITNENDVKKVCDNKDYVIHLAAIIPPKADKFPELARQVNIQGTKNIIRNIELYAPNAFFIYASSISVYGDRLKNPLITVFDPLLPSEGDEYATTKIAAEKVIQESKLDWSIFRLTAIMGNHKLTELLFHMPLATPMEIATPFDTANAFVRAIDHRGELSKKIFNLGGGIAYRILYSEFLSRSFDIVGLGKLDFPDKAFAEKNFHCGYYSDGNDLEAILHFRSGTIEDYFLSVRKSIHPLKRFFTRIFRYFIKKILLFKSEPLRAYRSGDKTLIHRFF